MNIEKKIISMNYDKGKIIWPRYVVIHETANTNAGAGAQSHFNYWNTNTTANSSAHFVVDDKQVIQLGEYENGKCFRMWHVGDNKGYSDITNDNAIGIEICVNSDGNFAKARQNAIELTRYILERTGLSASVVKRHRDASGKQCPATMLSKPELWTDFVNQVSAKLITVPLTPIMGKSVATIAQMTDYIKSKNPTVSASVINMIPLYISEGEIEGVRGDIAFAQSCLETGNFTFANSAVTLDQSNFCGMGVTSNGMKGNTFASPLIGIRAQIHHLKAYGSKLPLVNENQSPRFNLVTRGAAEYVEWLGQKENPQGFGWATGEGYGAKILNIWANILQMPISLTNSLDNTDNIPSGWATEAWNWGIENGITDGSNPKNLATREQVIQLFYTFNKYLNNIRGGIEL